MEVGRTILFAERVGGNTVTFERFGRRHVAAHNFAAIRVLEKCGFTTSGEAGDDGVSISGSSRLTGAVDIDEGTIDLSGSSIAEPSGTARGLEARVSGASQFDAPELTVGDLAIELSGASVADVYATGTHSAGASGASTLRYAGSPVVERSDVSGSSSIAPVG
jgi:hypothetical protein